MRVDLFVSVLRWFGFGQSGSVWYHVGCDVVVAWHSERLQWDLEFYDENGRLICRSYQDCERLLVSVREVLNV